ncbi:YsnF/AvaK domain-containing protein [Pseudokineococcus basanitobsidens]|uniref:YsnF/AvaK domain-containing protein n=1 Tax=Pseudokineococcus basanitobsidens TaxID=1926649 RepID=A0ABU8RPF1_9ACTN
MITTDQVQQLLSGGGTVTGEGGSKIGKVGQVFLDDQTGEPEWVTVKTGMLAGAETFVPLAQASVQGSEVQVPYGKDVIKDAPRISSDESLSQEQEAQLYRHYGLEYSEAPSDSGLPTGTADQAGAPAPSGAPAGDSRRDRAGEPGVEGQDTSGPTTDDAMTRSEEQLHVGTQSREAGRARLRKFVTTERVTQDVPVSHEEVRVDREPITEANRGDALAGGDLTEEEHEVTLHEERPVMDKETVPVERVRMGTQRVSGTEQVSEDVRKEQVETDAGDSDTSRS